MFYSITDGGWRRAHDRTRAAIISLSVYAWLESNCRWMLSSARVDGCHFSWQAIIPVPVFLVPFIPALSPCLSREKSVSVISDIYIALIAAGERMHGIEIQGYIRRVDDSSASGNWGFVFINCFRCHCPSPTLSERLLFCLPLWLALIQAPLLSSGLKDIYEPDCCYHFSETSPVWKIWVEKCFHCQYGVFSLPCS